MHDTTHKLSGVSIALHWLVGIAIIGLLAVGWYMETYEVFALYPTHKSIGILVFGVVLARVWWRAVQGMPPLLGNPPKWQSIAARSVHWILLIGTVLMPLTGIGMSVQGGHGLYVFGVELLAANFDAARGEVVALSEFAARGANTAHRIISKIMMLAIALHILGAVKHHFWDKDNTLRRMLGKAAK